MLLDVRRPDRRTGAGVRVADGQEAIANLSLAPVLTELLARLDRHPETPPLSDLADWLSLSRIDVDDLASFVRFDDRRYARNLLCATSHWEAWLLCWRCGQYSPIHDHQGSVCALKVLRGRAREVLYELTPAGRARPTTSYELPLAFVSAQADADIHRVIAVQELVTLHIYAPPLVAMRTYEEW
jgi:cysteine dioxygenase